MSKSLSLALSALLFLGGCAFGVKHDYQQQALDLGVTAPAAVAVGILDNRPYVVTGQKPPDFVGLSRGGFGNPFDVNTQSGQPLASEMSSSIVASLKAKGVDARAVELRHSLNAGEAVTSLRAAGTPRSVLIRLVEWKSDMAMNVDLIFDLDMQVLDNEGRVLVSKVERGRDNLGHPAFEPGGASLVLPRYRRMMETLFRQPDVAKALRP